MKAEQKVHKMGLLSEDLRWAGKELESHQLAEMVTSFVAGCAVVTIGLLGGDEWGEIEMALVQQKKVKSPHCLTNFGAHVSKKVGTKHIWVHFLNPFLGANFEPLLLTQLPNFDCCLISWPGDQNRSCALICWRVHLERFSFSRITSMIRSASVTSTYPPGN